MAHYGGALLNPKQVLGGGIHYNSPMSNIDVDRVGDNNQLDDSTIVGRGRDPNFNLQDYLKINLRMNLLKTMWHKILILEKDKYKIIQVFF